MLGANFTIGDALTYMRQLAFGAPKAAVVDAHLAWDFADTDADGIPDHWSVNDLRNAKRVPRSRGELKGLRKTRAVRGIVLHQTANAHLDADHRLIAGVPAHALVDMTGRLALLHHPQDVMWHAHALNRDTVGLELACRVPGRMHDGRTFWRSKREKAARVPWNELQKRPTDVQLERAREWCLWMADQCPKWPLQLWTHRQGHSSRTSDPGEEIVRKVILPLVDGWPSRFTWDPKATRGSGTAVPREWWD